MCTVTYISLGEHSFILTHNRDEHHSRSVALLPEKVKLHDKEIIFPKDEQGGGTWIAGNQDYTLCLLNGGYVKHISTPPYKHSRGLIILDFFKYANVEEFNRQYDFTHLEPFTLIIIDHHSQQIHEIINDSGKIYHTQKLHSQHHIWSSTTLYRLEERQKRQRWFKDWCTNKSPFTQKSMIEFHLKQYDEEQQEGIRINRESKLFTVSLSSIFKDNNAPVKWIYQDFINHKNTSIDF